MNDSDALLYDDLVKLPRMPHVKDVACHDCGALKWEFHEPGCDMEDCPRCGKQLLGCECVLLEEVGDG